MKGEGGPTGDPSDPGGWAPGAHAASQAARTLSGSATDLSCLSHLLPKGKTRCPVPRLTCHSRGGRKMDTRAPAPQRAPLHGGGRGGSPWATGDCGSRPWGRLERTRVRPKLTPRPTGLKGPFRAWRPKGRVPQSPWTIPGKGPTSLPRNPPSPRPIRKGQRTRFPFPRSGLEMGTLESSLSLHARLTSAVPYPTLGGGGAALVSLA